MNRMQKDFGAFRAKMIALAAIGSVMAFEKREAPEMKKLAEAIEGIGRGFEEYKKTNDQKIEAIKTGAGTADLDVKLANIDKELDKLSEVKSNVEKLLAKASRPGMFETQEGKASPEETEHKEAFMAWARGDKSGDVAQRLSKATKALEEKAASTVVGTNASGGYALPKVIEQQIARLSVDISPIRSLATVRTVSTTDYHELFDVNGAAFEWLGEGDARNQTNTNDLADVLPTFGMASAKPQSSEEALNDLMFDVEGWLVQTASESIAQGEGAAFISGNGIKKPTGFLTGTPVATADSGRAFGTLQYIASGGASAMPTSLDTMYDIVYALRARYRSNAKWLCAKLLLASLRKYKDSTNNYLWQPSLVAGQPDMFMGYPVVEAEDMPAVAVNSFPLAFGDFREGYLIADLVGMRITRDEITTPGQVKFYVRKRVGGKLRNSQAIKLLKIAAT